MVAGIRFRIGGAVGAAAVLLGSSVAGFAPENRGFCVVSGIVTAGTVPLPGVSLTLLNSENQVVAAGSSGVDGRYHIKAPAPGAYRLASELLRFAPSAQEISLAAAAGAGSCGAEADLRL